VSDSGRSRRIKEYSARFTNPKSDPRILDSLERQYEGLRKAGMPEE
jgi:hypothetical protein